LKSLKEEQAHLSDSLTTIQQKGLGNKDSMATNRKPSLSGMLDDSEGFKEHTMDMHHSREAER
jgi:hypothetical protein